MANADFDCPSGMYVLGTVIFALFARGEVQPFNFVTFNQGIKVGVNSISSATEEMREPSDK